MKNFNYIEIEVRDKRATILLNRPEVHNALNAGMVDEMDAAISFLEKQEDLSLLILRGKGKSFSSGADLRNMHDMSGKDFEANYRDAAGLAKLLLRLYSFPKPVVSVLHGKVYGGANGLMAASDIALAEEDTEFRFSEIHLGLVPAVISPYILLKTGISRTKELMLTGRAFGTKEALEYSLIHFITGTRVLNVKLEEICKGIERGGPSAVQKTKQLLNENFYTLPGPGLIEKTAQVLAEVRSSAEGKEGLSAFVEKRPPGWING